MAERCHHVGCDDIQYNDSLDICEYEGDLMALGAMLTYDRTDELDPHDEVRFAFRIRGALRCYRGRTDGDTPAA